MRKKDRVINALNGQPVDRPPVSNPTNVATVELMDLVDAPFPAAGWIAVLQAGRSWPFLMRGDPPEILHPSGNRRNRRGFRRRSVVKRCPPEENQAACCLPASGDLPGIHHS